MTDVMTAIPMTRKSNLLARSAMTPMERRAGRFLRAPDHDASTPADIPAGDADAVDAAATDAPADTSTTLLGGEPEAAKGGDQQSDDKGGEPDPAAALLGAPEHYDFTMPEGVPFDQEAFDAFEPALREMNLSQEAANKLVGTYADKVLPVLQARAEQQASTAGEELRADWAKATLGDKELGGAKLEESKAMAARTIAKFLPQSAEGQQFRTFLNESGLGNHPEMMRLLARVGRGLGEATVDTGNAAGEALSSAEKFYGKGYGKQN